MIRSRRLDPRRSSRAARAETRRASCTLASRAWRWRSPSQAPTVTRRAPECRCQPEWAIRVGGTSHGGSAIRACNFKLQADVHGGGDAVIGRGYLSLIPRHCMMGAGPGAAGHRAGATGTERGMRPAGGECRAVVRGGQSARRQSLHYALHWHPASRSDGERKPKLKYPGLRPSTLPVQ